MPQEKSKLENRRYPRINKNLPIKIRNGDFDIVTETKNISCTGAYCQVDRYVSPFTKINARILIPAKTKTYINCQGIVVRVEKGDNDLETQYNIAIYFNDISKSDMSKIDRFVKSQPNYS